MTRPTIFASDEFYHVYNRGTDKRTVFTKATERKRFLALLYACNSDKAVELKLQGSTLEEMLKTNYKRGKELVDICAYCLMPNHFHLLLREKNDGGISRFMQKLLTAYTMYFNKKHERSGSLFQGRFKAARADNDEYLKYLISYIHLNPVKLIDAKWKENGIRNLAATEKFLATYRYSSYLDFLESDRIEKVILNKSALPEYFENLGDFKNSVREWLKYNAPDSKVEPWSGGSTLE